jgi:purine-nucleoside phosphorylase
MKKLDLRYSTGVYCGVSGPTYETAAEVRFLQTIGGQAVGMSTVPETIAAKHMGLSVCGISCISNLATGISQSPITHEEVKETAKMVERQFTSFLSEFIQSL